MISTRTFTDRLHHLLITRRKKPLKGVAVSIILALALGIALAPATRVLAAEGGAGHYLPGAVATFIDEAPPKETPFALENQFYYYSGSVDRGRQLRLGGIVAGNISATSYAEAPLFAYRSPLSLLGGDFAFAISIPYVWLDVNGEVSLSRTRLIDGRVVERIVTRSDSADGLGDITLIPFWWAWTIGDLKWDVRLMIFAPTGEYNVGQLANVGLNYWTFTPMVTASYLSSKYGFEITSSIGLDFNTENTATDYQSGDAFHFELTAAQHLPFFGLGTIGVGANFFYWGQITGDSGSEAELGSLEGHTTGIGPVVNYISPNKNLLFEVKGSPKSTSPNVSRAMPYGSKPYGCFEDTGERRHKHISEIVATNAKKGISP
jgi:hypothetical protein